MSMQSKYLETKLASDQDDSMSKQVIFFDKANDNRLETLNETGNDSLLDISNSNNEYSDE